MFDLSIPKLLVLAVIALIIFGPNELPKIASQAGRALRDLRRIAEGAKNDLREGLGPEFADLELEDLNPKRFVQKHLFDDINGDQAPGTAPRPAARGPTARCSPPASAPPTTPTRPEAAWSSARCEAELAAGQAAAPRRRVRPRSSAARARPGSRGR